MFNFQNMNDYEFELLCKDVLEIELNKKLRTYSKGRDGGIDINGFVAGDTIVQVKHYINSTYSNLLSSLKNEVDKINNLNPNNYYICTPLRLTPTNITELYNLFKNYMPSPQNIYDGIRLDDFLSKEDNADIVYNHYKLWLTSSNVLGMVSNKDIFIDTDELMFGIEKEINLFVETKAYHDAIKIFEKEKLIIILGDPGVGKTTISKMLLLYYTSLGYCVRYASDNSIKDIKKVLSRDLSKKEIILMDDFLGQHYLNIKEGQPNEIKSLISYILRNNNKRLILNSRITILNEALRRSFQLKNFLDDNEIKKYIIDLNKMPVSERAKIFYNHIFFNRLPIEYFIDIKRDRRYINVVNHKNYNPRIIEYTTKSRNYSQCSANKYYSYIMNKLDNPLDIWEDEFNNRIGNFDRIFMYTLYSLTDTFIEEIIIKKCFNMRIKNEPNYDSTRDVFSECLTRLTKSMVRIIEEKGHKKIGVLNPSINDYIFYHLKNNENEVDCILTTSIYIDQVDRIGKFSKNRAAQSKLMKLSTDKFLSMKAISKTIEYHYMESIYYMKYKDSKIKDKLINIISDPKTYFNNPREVTSTFLCNLFSESDIFEFYDFEDLLFDFDKMKAVFDELVFEDINDFLAIYKSYVDKKPNKEEWIRNLRYALMEHICRCISEDAESEIGNSLYDIVSSTINNADREDISEYYNGHEYPLTRMVKDSITQEIDDIIDNKKDEIDTELFSVDELEISSKDILEQLDYTSQIEEFFREEPDYDYEDRSSSSNGYEEVHEIFNREYSPPPSSK